MQHAAWRSLTGSTFRDLLAFATHPEGLRGELGCRRPGCVCLGAVCLHLLLAICFAMQGLLQQLAQCGLGEGLLHRLLACCMLGHIYSQQHQDDIGRVSALILRDRLGLLGLGLKCTLPRTRLRAFVLHRGETHHLRPTS